jgi:phospholipase C
MLVVSPFSTGGFVCHDTFDHTSQLRFLETLLGVSVPNLSSWRRSVTGDLSAALPHAGVADTTPPTLPVVSTDTTKRPLSECASSQFKEDNIPTSYRVLHPRHQVMATQAPGTLIPTPT